LLYFCSKIQKTLSCHFPVTFVFHHKNRETKKYSLYGDDAVFLVPVTLDFPVESVTETGETQISAAPYLGGGVAISTGDDSNVGFLLSGGVDVPIANQLTANAGVNVSFLDDTNIGLLLGVGYNF
jgi:hypothetical protein